MRFNDEAVQEIFIKVIDAGIYPDNDFMCLALSWAERRGLITSAEQYVATVAIEDYLLNLCGRNGATGTLLRAIHDGGMIPSRFEYSTSDWAQFYGVEIYLNWAKRPIRR